MVVCSMKDNSVSDLSNNQLYRACGQFLLRNKSVVLIPFVGVLIVAAIFCGMVAVLFEVVPLFSNCMPFFWGIGAIALSLPIFCGSIIFAACAISFDIIYRRLTSLEGKCKGILRIPHLYRKLLAWTFIYASNGALVFILQKGNRRKNPLPAVINQKSEWVANTFFVIPFLVSENNGLLEALRNSVLFAHKDNQRVFQLITKSLMFFMLFIVGFSLVAAGVLWLAGAFSVWVCSGLFALMFLGVGPVGLAYSTIFQAMLFVHPPAFQAELS